MEDVASLKKRNNKKSTLKRYEIPEERAQKNKKQEKLY
jgi:hypothetical protein